MAKVDAIIEIPATYHGSFLPPRKKSLMLLLLLLLYLTEISKITGTKSDIASQSIKPRLIIIRIY